MMLAICHSEAMGWEQVEDLSKMSDLIAEGRLVWAQADAAHLDDSDLATISEEFGLHPLAVEDALQMGQRPKLDVFENHLFIVMHELVQVADQLEAIQVASFIGDHFVLTIHEGASNTIDETKARWEQMTEGFHREPTSLVYVLMDVMVDNYQLIAEHLENTIEDLEDVTLSLIDMPMHERMRATTTSPAQRRFYEVKQRASRLRRYVSPVGAILDALLTEPINARVPDKIEELLADVQDHVHHVGDQIRNVDELTEAMLELRRAEQATALNEVTKKLTGWAAIIAVPTLISSVYGMNFALLPTQGSLTGFWFAVALMALTGLLLYLFFKRQHWI